MTPTRRAFVLSGGGARGALQVGALHALLEAGIQPDLLVGTSIGAANATFVAVRGFSKEGLETLEQVWREAASAELMPSNYLWLTVRVLFNRISIRPYHHRLREFFISHGLPADLRFGDLTGPELILVAADLNKHETVLYGNEADQLVLEGLLASTAIPPWVQPLEIDGSYLMDGGLVSNLPIEPALRCGATEIIALDLFDPRSLMANGEGFGPFLAKMLATIEKRQMELELELARQRDIPILHLRLQPSQPVPIWDFSHTEELLARGYTLAQKALAGWSPQRPGYAVRLMDWWRATLGRGKKAGKRGR